MARVMILDTDTMELTEQVEMVLADEGLDALDRPQDSGNWVSLLHTIIYQPLDLRRDDIAFATRCLKRDNGHPRSIRETRRANKRRGR